MEFRNAIFNVFGTINCEINHPELGWIPFTASPDDVEQIGRDIFAAAQSSGEVAAYVAPPAPTLEQERAAMQCSPAQMRLTLNASGLLATVQGIADADPEASILWEYATTIRRTSPLIDALGGPNGFTPEQIDDLFRAAMAVDI